MNILTLLGMAEDSLKPWRTDRVKNGSRSRRIWSKITAVLKAKRAIESARDGEIVAVSPLISSLIAGLACFFSIWLIHPLLQGSQTTLAFQSSMSDDQSATICPSSFLLVNRFLPGTKSFIQSLHRCSADSLAISGQNAHSLAIQHYC